MEAPERAGSAAMSNKHITWARGVSGVAAVSKSVLLLLADSADGKGECFPSVPTMARELSRSGRCVQQHLRQLESIGLISIRPRYVDSGRQSSSVYQLNMQVAQGSLSESEARTGRVNPFQGEGESCAGGEGESGAGGG